MNDLINKKCVPCEGSVPAFDLSEISNGGTSPRQGMQFFLCKSVIIIFGAGEGN